MTLDDFRALALALPGVEEGLAYGSPIWRVGKRMLTRVWEDGETVVLKMDEAMRDALIAAQPDVFFVTDHYLGHPLGLARLTATEADQIAEILRAGWRDIAPKRLRLQTSPANLPDSS